MAPGTAVPGGGGGCCPVRPGPLALPCHPPGHVTVTGATPERFWRYPSGPAGTGREQGWARARRALPDTFPARWLLVCSSGLLLAAEKLASPSSNRARRLRSPLHPEGQPGKPGSGISPVDPLQRDSNHRPPCAEAARSPNPGWTGGHGIPSAGIPEQRRGGNTWHEHGAGSSLPLREHVDVFPGSRFQEGSETRLKDLHWKNRPGRIPAAPCPTPELLWRG